MLLPGVVLTDSQKTQLRALHADKHHEMRTHMERMRAIDAQIDEILLADGPVDGPKLHALVDEKQKMMEVGEQARLDDAIKLHDLLTPAQRAQARENRTKLDGLEAQIRTILHAPKGDGPGPDEGGPDSGPPDGGAPAGGKGE